MEVKLKKLNENAKLPQKGKPGDFCYDVYAITEEEVAPNVWCYTLGFAYEFDRNNIQKIQFDKTLSDVNLAIHFFPRSSVWKTGMVLSNSVGCLDEFYRGEAKAVFYHVMPNMPRYVVGDRIGQISLGITIPLDFNWVEDINMDTERGKGGFGSTGLK